MRPLLTDAYIKQRLLSTHSRRSTQSAENPAEQQLAPLYGGRAVIQQVPVKDGILDYLGARRELPPCQIDVFGRSLCGIDVPEMSFNRRARINLPCDDLEMRKEPLN